MSPILNDISCCVTLLSVLCGTVAQGWRITRVNSGPRGDHFRFHNTEFNEGPLFRAALGNEARANGEGFVWDKVDRFWWVSVSNAARYIASSDGTELDEEDITEELLEEVVRSADLSERD